MPTSPARFVPEFLDYLSQKLKIARDKVRVNTSGRPEGRALDEAVLTVSLSTPRPYVTPDGGAGRHSYQVIRSLEITITSTVTGDHGSDRTRALTAHWAFEDKVLNAVQQCDFRANFGWARPPALQGSPPDYQHLKDVVGGLQSTLVFEITYEADIQRAQPGPPV